jgi:hypothetical protein
VNGFAEVWDGPIRGGSGVMSWPVRSGSGSSVGVAGGDGAFAEFGQHGGVVDVEVFADSCE